MRYLFAMGVYFNHLYTAVGREIILCNSGLFVSGFFILSGLFTMNSYFSHPDWRRFAVRRMNRILPAYWMTILICLLIGIFFTSLTFQQFLLHPETWKYALANSLFLNFLQPTLPGVFTVNPLPHVNASLWFVKVILLCYLTVPFFYALMKRYRPAVVLSFIVGISLLCLIATSELYIKYQIPFLQKFNHQFLCELPYFYIPVFFLLFPNWIRNHAKLIFFLL